jgi:hypothetical protein
MKKSLPYIIGIVVTLLLVAVIAAGSRKKKVHEMDERLTFRQKDKIPYGTSAALALLPALYPDAEIYTDKKAPGYWADINSSSYNQAVVIVSRVFNANEYEIDQLISFVEKGNYVFILSKNFSEDAEKFFNFSYGQNGFDDYLADEDSMMLTLSKPAYSNEKYYTFPGKRFEGWFTFIDTLHTTVLGKSINGKPDFIQFKRGQGSIFIHTAPVAFSNYFVLHKNNVEYFEKAMSVIPKGVEKILWNEYYLDKKINSSNEDKEPSWLNVLFRYPAFKWGLLTALFALILYVLLGMRRRQRMIPLHQKPKNDSMDFVKTMGRLYYDRKDHDNLARKMAVYFLEHVRTAYKIPTHTLDDEFVQALHYKSSYPFAELQQIISFISYLQNNPSVKEIQLKGFHKQLETFYQNT